MIDTETDARPLAPDLGHWSERARRAVEALVSAEFAALDVTPPLWWVLEHTEADGGIDRAVLAERLRDRVANAATIPEAIEEARARGWLLQSDAGRLSLTGAGRAAHARIGDLVADLDERIHRGVSEEDRRRVVATLRRIIVNAGGEAV